MAAAVPSLLLVLVVLVRDSSNFKIKTHAAAALSALGSRDAFGDVFADAMLVLLGALEALNSGGCGSSAATAANNLAAVAAPGQQQSRGTTVASAASTAAGAGAVRADAAGAESGFEDDGSFPNFRYIPSLTEQLELSLLHMLALLQASDAARLKVHLNRSRPLLLSTIQKHAVLAAAAAAAQPVEDNGSRSSSVAPVAAHSAVGCGCSGGASAFATAANTGVAAAGAAAATGSRSQGLPVDPFSQGDNSTSRSSESGSVLQVDCPTLDHTTGSAHQQQQGQAGVAAGAAGDGSGGNGGAGAGAVVATQVPGAAAAGLAAQASQALARLLG